MTVEMVYEDPETFLTPWKVVWALFLAPGEDLLEEICNENNKFPQLSGGTESLRDPASPTHVTRNGCPRVALPIQPQVTAPTTGRRHGAESALLR